MELLKSQLFSYSIIIFIFKITKKHFLQRVLQQADEL